MAWKLEISKSARKQLVDLGSEEQKRILGFLYKRLAALDDPRSIGEALKGQTLGGLWKYRVGDYRLICDIQDQRVSILVVKIGNRREVYRRQ